MARKEGAEDIDNYLKEMEKFLINPREFSASGNQEIDGVVNYLLGKAAGNLKNVSVNISIPEQYFQGDFMSAQFWETYWKMQYGKRKNLKKNIWRFRWIWKEGYFILKLKIVIGMRNIVHLEILNMELVWRA